MGQPPKAEQVEELVLDDYGYGYQGGDAGMTDDEVMEVRKLIRVEPHEVAITRDVSGSYTFFNGSAGGIGTSFFLPPYSELVTMKWSDDHGVAGMIEVTKIDLRAQKMFFKFEVRTSDNVKLRLEGTIFWQVKDVAKMLSMTSDPAGDISQHARSALIQAVSKVPLSKFMSDFNNITMEAFGLQAADGFYAERGVELQSMEVTRFDCVDRETAMVSARGRATSDEFFELSAHVRMRCDRAGDGKVRKEDFIMYGSSALQEAVEQVRVLQVVPPGMLRHRRDHAQGREGAEQGRL